MSVSDPSAPHKTRSAGLALALLAATQFVLILDASIVNVALPSIGSDLHFAREDLSWVVNAYTLAFGGFLLLGGRAADLLGRRRMFMAGLALFTLASLVGGFATDGIALVAARAVQGLGAAMVAPAALSLVMTLFPAGPDRNKALGVFGAVAGTGGAAGAILGGTLTDWFGWEAVLWVNVPIGVVVIALAPRLLPEARDRSVRGFDLFGALTVTAGVGVLAYAIVDSAAASTRETAGLTALALVLLAVFVLIQTRSTHPLVPLAVLRRLGHADLLNVLVAMAMIPMFYTMTLYVQTVLGYSPIKAGLAQMPVAVAIAISAGVASNLVTRFGPKLLATAGFLVIAAGLAWFSRLGGGGYLADVFGPSVVLGIGGGLTWVSTSVAATAPASTPESGLASGLLNTAQQIGGTLGLALLVSVAASTTRGSSAADPLAALTDGYQTALLTGVGFALAGALLASFLRFRPAVAAEEETVAVPEVAKA